MSDARAFTLLIDGRPHELAPETDRDGALWLPASTVREQLGWKLDAAGLCHQGMCIPRSLLGAGVRDDAVELHTLARALGRPLAFDHEERVAALGMPMATRARTFERFEAPDVTLPTVAGGSYSLSQARGSKVLVVAYGSWCGCREDLPAWQALHAELAGHGFTLLTVALDRRVEDARPFVERAAPTHPCLLDPEHRFADAYSILNVPTGIWIDERGTVVRPNEPAFATDLFVAFHGQPSGPYLDAVRAWVLQDELPLDPEERRARQRPLSAEEQLAKVEGSLAYHLLATGRTAAAERHFDRAAELSPFDWTIRRASMPLRDQDPFGVDFAPLWEEFERAGRPYYQQVPTEQE